MPTVTIRDVARRAGVSSSTVSHVLNRTRFVAPGTRDEVLRAIKELEYHPSAIARSLRRKQTETVGVIVSDISNPFFTDLVRGVEDACNPRDFNLVVCSTDEDSIREADYLRMLYEKQVDGVILAPTAGPHDTLVGLIRRGLRAICIDRWFSDIPTGAVVTDNRDAARAAVEHLISLGHRRIGVVAGLPGISTTWERLKGYSQALQAHGIPADGDLVRCGNSKIGGGFQATLELLATQPPPSALFVTNNLMTIGAMNALRERGLRCPEDVAIVAFDDFPWATAFRPYLTVVAQPTYEIGQRAAQILLSAIRKRTNVSQEKVILSNRFVVRESSGS